MSGAEIALIAIAVAGAAVSAYGVYQSGQAQEEAGKYNAKIARNQADAARIASEVREKQQREHLRRLQGSQAAAYGAAGGDIGSGSPLLVIADTAAQAEMDILNEKYVTQARASGAEGQAALSEYQGRQAARAGTIQAGGTLLSSAGSIGSRYYARGSGLTTRYQDSGL